MKKIFYAIIVLAAVAMVSCGGNANTKSADANDVTRTECAEGSCCAEKAETDCCDKSECAQGACDKKADGECCKGEKTEGTCCKDKE